MSNLVRNPNCWFSHVEAEIDATAHEIYQNINQRTNGPVNAHLSLLHIPINMFEYYGI